MNTKRAILMGALLWVLIFFEVSILMFGFKLSAGATYYTIHYIALTILTLIVAVLYFKKAKKGAKEGLLTGVVMMATGIILDAIITVPLFIKSYGFFADPYLIAGYVWGILLVVIVGVLKKK